MICICKRSTKVAFCSFHLMSESVTLIMGAAPSTVFNANKQSEMICFGTNGRAASNIRIFSHSGTTALTPYKDESYLRLPPCTTLHFG